MSKPHIWNTRLTRDMIARYEQSGQWANVTIGESARECALNHPDRIAVIDGAHTRSFGQIYEQALRLAKAFRDCGLEPGDVVSFQLPNWYETLEINIAAALGGLIITPIIPIYRDSEVCFILKDSRARLIFVPESFRGMDYPEMISRIRPQLPELERVIVLRSSGENPDSYERFKSDQPLEAAALPPVDANSIKLLLYTSGTTGDPKGVLHSHNTLRSDTDATIRFRGLRPDDITLMPSPVTHITGLLYALELPFALGASVVLMDRWNAADAVRLIESFQITLSNGATPFLAELVAQLEASGQQLPSLRLFATGGAPVPSNLVLRASQLLPNCRIFRAYGCSEAPTISLGLAQNDPPELGMNTDGLIYNHEVRIVDIETGITLEPGHSGEILTRGPEVMLGYTSARHTTDAFDEDGFFRTGDIGLVDGNGYITITGRKKDLIIRGGENLSPKEIEDALYKHPSIRDVAVVAMPHARMGETPCACVVLKEGTSLDFDDMKDFLENARFARQKFPEKLIIFQALPHNAAGKVLKQELKAVVAREAVADSASTVHI